MYPWKIVSINNQTRHVTLKNLKTGTKISTVVPETHLGVELHRKHLESRIRRFYLVKYVLRWVNLGFFILGLSALLYLKLRKHH
jgi:hypothetical protein